MESIYDRYGGEPFWDSFLDLFYHKNIQDPILREYFEGKDIERVKKMNQALLLAALRASEDHFSVSVKRVHKNMSISAQQFNHFANNFAAQLQELKVGKDDVDEIMNVVTSFQEDIVKE